MNERKPDETFRNAWKGYSIGISMVSATATCAALGWLADWLMPALFPFGIVTGAMFGVFAAVYVGLKESRDDKNGKTDE